VLAWRGTTLEISVSCLLVVLLLAAVFAPRVRQASPAIGDWSVVVGVGVGVLVYLSALLHEVGHAVLACRYGHEVPAIGLSMAGGRTAVVGAARTPGEELATSAAGPVVSVGVGLVALAAARGVDDALVVEVLEALVLANLLLGLLDLLPAPPLDGGRVARAIGWWVGGTKARGVRAAVWSGRVVAVAVLVYPAVAIATWSPLPIPLLLLLCPGVALVLWLAAAAEAGTVPR
jgi:Zn-dependent protease